MTDQEIIHLTRAAHSGMLSFERTRRPQHLSDVISSMQKAIDITTDNHPRRFSFFLTLSMAYSQRYRFSDNLSDLNAGISAAKTASKLTAEDDLAAQSGILGNLSSDYRLRYLRLSNLSDLEEAVSTGEIAVALTPDESRPEKAGRLVNLCNAYIERFERLGDIEDIEKALQTGHQAAGSIPDGHPMKAMLVSKLSAAYGSRGQRLGELADLEQSIHYGRRAVELIPDGHPEKPVCLSNLCIALGRRFERLGEVTDISEAISIGSRSVQLSPDSDPDKPARLSNLAAAYGRRYEHYGDALDIQLSISAGHRAVELTPDGHSYKRTWLGNLCSAHLARYAHRGELRDLEAALAAGKHAVSLTPDGDPDKPGFVSNLCVVHTRKFEHTGQISDITEALSYGRKALSLVPDGHALKPAWNLNLAEALVAVSTPSTPESQPQVSDLREAEDILKAAAHDIAGIPTVRLRAAMKWAGVRSHPSLQATAQERIAAHRYVVALVPQVTWLGFDVRRRYEEMSTIGSVVNRAASVAIEAGDFAQALECLEEGRCVVWGQALQLRSPLDQLRQVHPDLASDLERTSRGLQESSDTVGTQEYIRRQATKRHALAMERESLLKQIREQPGFSDFLGPKTISQFAPACASGPVVFINVDCSRCDALILYGTGEVKNVPLSKFSYEQAEEMHTTLVSLLRMWHVRDRAARPVRSNNKDESDPMARLLKELWESVVKPVWDVVRSLLPVKDTERLPRITWCPSGPIAFLPLHAAGDYDKKINIMQFVVSSYTPSMEALLRGPLATSHARPNLLLVSQADVPGATRLPGTEEEKRRILARFSGSATVLEGQQGNVSGVLEAMATHSWVHFACHGIQHAEQPTQSAFLLHDGKLELSQLMAQSFGIAELAVLSACQTATGDKKLPEEVAHLAAGMLSVGYKSVVGTMWSIRDRDAPIVADAFYEKILEDCDEGREIQPAYALHEATKRLRESKEVGMAGFLRWIPFVHFGI